MPCPRSAIPIQPRRCTSANLTHDTLWHRLQDYEIPAQVDVAMDAVFGLHGLPLPPKSRMTSAGPGMPPAVTPEVLYNAYNIKGVKPTGSTANRVRAHVRRCPVDNFVHSPS